MLRNNLLLTISSIILISSMIIFSPFAWSKNSVNIGILVDANDAQQNILVSRLRQELELLLSSKYKINLNEKNILSSHWSTAESLNNYITLSKNNTIDIIISVGIITSSVVIQQKTFNKPVIAIGIVAPESQNILLTQSDTSGINNLSYILFNRSISNDLDTFFQISPYKKVALIASSHLISQLSLSRSKQSKMLTIQKLMERNGTEFVALPVEKKISEASDKLNDIDAVYVGYLGRLEGDGKDKLINTLMKRKIPSFSFTATDVERGVLFSNAPKLPIDKIVRRLALNIEAILDGKNASTLPVSVSFLEKLTVNMETAKRIGYSPSFNLLSKANLIKRFTASNQEVLTLKQAIQEAISANLDLKVETEKVNVSQLDVKLAQANQYPSLTLNTTATQIDKDRAAASFGNQPERNTSVSIRLEQLLYSESVSGNIDIQHYILDSAKQGYQIQKLDIIQNTANAYFDLLRASTTRNIQSENVNITRKNLDLSKQRESAGYSGRSDVYYWESQLASAETAYLSAINQYKLVQIQLNLLLNRPLDNDFNTENFSLYQGEYALYIKETVKKYVKTPATLERFTQFLVVESLNNAPEISQLNANISAQQRRHTSSRKKRYIPTASLVAESQRVYTRSGAGSSASTTTQDDDTWSASVNLSWPLYSGGSISTEGQQALTQILQLKDQLAQIRQSIELNVRSNMLDLATKFVNVSSSQQSAFFADKSLSLVQDSYIKGKASVAELSDAQKNSVIAKQRSLNSNYEYFSAVINIERAVGKYTLLSSPQAQAGYIQRLETYFSPNARIGAN